MCIELKHINYWLHWIRLLHSSVLTRSQIWSDCVSSCFEGAFQPVYKKDEYSGPPGQRLNVDNPLGHNALIQRITSRMS